MHEQTIIKTLTLSFLVTLQNCRSYPDKSSIYHNIEGCRNEVVRQKGVYNHCDFDFDKNKQT